VTPDVAIDHDAATLAAGTHVQLEKALEVVAGFKYAIDRLAILHVDWSQSL